jgi:hypothetical protein
VYAVVPLPNAAADLALPQSMMGNRLVLAISILIAVSIGGVAVLASGCTPTENRLMFNIIELLYPYNVN